MKNTIPYRLNFIITLGIILFHIYSFIILPVYLLPQSMLWALTLVPFIWVFVTHWGLIHEAIHKHLHANNKINEYEGRVLSILMGTSFHVLRFAHLMHHKLNRNWLTELAPKKSFSKTIDHYFQMLGGLYLSEVLSTIFIGALSHKQFMKLAAKTNLQRFPDIMAAG